MEKRGWNRNTLKMIAAVFMALDSLCLRGMLPDVFHLLTRFVAPLFAWLMVDGFFHTRNRAKYCGRMWIAACLMQIGDVCSYLIFGKEYGISDNIFLTLAIGFSMMMILESAKKQSKGKCVLLRICVILILFLGFALSLIPIPLIGGCSIMVEGGIMIPPVILISYQWYGNLKKQAVLDIIWCLLIGFVLYGYPMRIADIMTDPAMLFIESDWMMFLFIPFMFLYNGKPGKKNKMGKYFFYIFYPAHLWMIALIQFLILQK